MRFYGTSRNDAITGTDLADIIEGLAGHDSLRGGDGDDVIEGGDGNDTLYANGRWSLAGGGLDDPGTESDRLSGGAGDDAVAGGWNDFLDGGAGQDRLYLDLRGADRGVVLDLGDLADGATVSIGMGIVSGFERLNRFHATLFADAIRADGRVGVPIEAGDGDDVIDLTAVSGGQLNGGDGYDIAIMSAGSVGVVYVNANGALTIYASAFSNVPTWTISGIEEFRIGSVTRLVRDMPNSGGMMSDGRYLFGDDGDDIIAPGSPAPDGALVSDASDILYGAGGDDVLDGGLGGDVMWGGDGKDIFIVNETTDVVKDGGGWDTVITSVDFEDPRTYEGLGRIVLVGSDDLTVNAGSTVIVGNAGDNFLSARHATVSYETAASRVVVDLARFDAQDTRGGGVDTLSGFDHLTGSAFDDVLWGRADDNVLQGGAGDDRLFGRGGRDTASYTDATAGVTVDLSRTGAQDTGGAGQDTLSGIENVRGSDFADVLRGAMKRNDIWGGAGDDVIWGAFQDQIEGGTGADRFMFDDALPVGGRILDFDQSAGDEIDLSWIDANTIESGDQGFDIVPAFTGTSGELVIAMRRYSALLQGDTDGDGLADFSIGVAFYAAPLDPATIAI